MRLSKIILLCLPLLLIAKEKNTITFPSADGLMITADTYLTHSADAPFIVLFHQAGWSRGEYLEIAPKLNTLGFNCMAIDQRSGSGVNDVKNETHALAESKSLPTNYLDAYADMLAAVKYAREHFAKGKILIWGSSYSAALTLRFAGEYADLIDGALAFSPGEYFARFGKSKTYVTEKAKLISDPVFVTSAKDEGNNWASIFAAIPGTHKTSFLPATTGNHGSRALWAKWKDHDAYWNAVKSFLSAYFTEQPKK